MSKDELFFTKQQFEELRKEITDIFENDEVLNKMYNITRTTYETSKKYNWEIRLSVREDWRNAGGLDGSEKIQIITKLFSKVKNFIENDERNFDFKNLYSRGGGLSFEFIFQPIAARAIQLLNRDK